MAVGLADTAAAVDEPKGFLKLARSGGGGDDLAGDCVLRFGRMRRGGDDARSRLLDGDRFFV